VWRCGRFSLTLERTLVMGVLNVTPDSFSDGGRYADPLAALRHGHDMATAGAAVIDVGGESTRPGSDEVSEAEEIARVVDVVGALASGLDVPVSIDTRHAAVARACIERGASVINDVSGFRDPAMVEVALGCDAGLVVMHMRGEPKTMQDEPRYDDVVAEVLEYLLGQAAMLEAHGVKRDRIAIDPGIGFGKTTAHNLELLRRIDEFAGTGYPVVVGASRKRFIGEVAQEPDPAKRAAGSIAAAVWSALHGASVVRAHDVAETVQALAVAHAISRGGA
jgi:dihydropteroate synthase